MIMIMMYIYAAGALRINVQGTKRKASSNYTKNSAHIDTDNEQDPQVKQGETQGTDLIALRISNAKPLVVMIMIMTRMDTDHGQETMAMTATPPWVIMVMMMRMQTAAQNRDAAPNANSIRIYVYYI
jgi:hypothetical protein